MANHAKLLAFFKDCRIRPTDDHKEIYTPTLYGRDTSGSIRQWRGIIGIPDVDVTREMVESREDVATAYHYTVSGVKGTNKPIISDHVRVKTGKNIGKANATTPLTQAISAIQTKFDKKIKEGYKLRESELLDRNSPIDFITLVTTPQSGPNPPWRVIPAASHKYQDHQKKLPKLVEVQPKFDGTMAIAVHLPRRPRPDDIAWHTVDFYSRGGETEHSQPTIREHLGKMLKSYPGIYVCGEMWRHGYGLQEISGASRKKDTADLQLFFYIFDMFDPSRPSLSRNERLEILLEIFNAADPSVASNVRGNKHLLQQALNGDLTNTMPRLRLIPTYRDKTRDEVEALYESFLEEDLEGAMIRNPSGRHEYGLNGEIRSSLIQKYKPIQDAEWPVVGYTDGNGKEEGVITWICAAADDFTDDPLEDRKTFNVSMNASIDVRRNIFTAMTNKIFRRDFYGQLMKIKYSDIYKSTGLPQQPKALMFRDDAVQKKLMLMAG